MTGKDFDEVRAAHPSPRHKFDDPLLPRALDEKLEEEEEEFKKLMQQAAVKTAQDTPLEYTTKVMKRKPTGVEVPTPLSEVQGEVQKLMEGAETAHKMYTEVQSKLEAMKEDFKNRVAPVDEEARQAYTLLNEEMNKVARLIGGDKPGEFFAKFKNQILRVKSGVVKTPQMPTAEQQLTFLMNLLKQTNAQIYDTLIPLLTAFQSTALGETTQVIKQIEQWPGSKADLGVPQVKGAVEKTANVVDYVKSFVGKIVDMGRSMYRSIRTISFNLDKAVEVIEG